MMDAPLDGAGDEARFLEDPQMPGDRWLRRLETTAEIAGTSGLPSRENVNDGPPRPICQGMERAIQ